MQAAEQIATMLPPAYQPVARELAATMRKLGVDGAAERSAASMARLPRLPQGLSIPPESHPADTKHSKTRPALPEVAASFAHTARDTSGRNGRANRALLRAVAAEEARGEQAPRQGTGASKQGRGALGRVAQGGEMLMQWLPRKSRTSQVCACSLLLACQRGSIESTCSGVAAR